MSRALLPDQIKQDHDQGWLSPPDFLSNAEVAITRANLEAFEAEHGPISSRPERSRGNLPFRWVDDIMRHPRLVAMVQDVVDLGN